MTLKQDLPPSMEAAAVLDLANTGMERLLASLYPARSGLHASDMTDPSIGRPTLAARRKMLAGYYVEQKWLAAFQEAGVLVYPGRLRGGLADDVHGRRIFYNPDAIIRPDGVLESEHNFWRHRPTDLLIEIKSASRDVFTEVQRGMGPFRKHLLRTELYLHLTGIYRGFLLYEDRDSCAPLVLPVGPLTPERREAIQRYLAQKVEPFDDVEDGGGATGAALGLGETSDLDRGSMGRPGVRVRLDRNEGRGADQPEAPDVVDEGAG